MSNCLRIFEKFKIGNQNIKQIDKVLGKGAFGEVRVIIMNNKKYAGKLIEKKKNKKSEEEEYGTILRGKNFINISKVLSREIDEKFYDLIIMEKANFRDSGQLIDSLYQKKLNKIYYPFDEVLGDNLLRFYSKQIINALNLIDTNYFIHNDIKPQNILITNDLIVKLTDYSFLTKVKDQETIIIPGGTPGYFSPEFYINKEVDSEVARKQDYFALGSTLYFLKYGKLMLRYNENKKEKILNADEIIKLLEQERDKIKSGKISDREFINFLCSLVEYKPEDRPCFEEIYRNIWLNKNSEQINNIHSINIGEEKRIIYELQKSDFLNKKENEQKSEENKNIKKDPFKKKKNNKLCRFRFKKRINKKSFQ